MTNELQGKEWDKCRHTYLLKSFGSIGLSTIEVSGRELLKELSFKANKHKKTNKENKRTFAHSIIYVS